MPDDIELPWGPDTSLLEEENLDEEHIRTYLDECIEHWRASDADFAEYYVDAFQSVRASMLGELLPEED